MLDLQIRTWMSGNSVSPLLQLGVEIHGLSTMGIHRGRSCREAVGTIVGAAVGADVDAHADVASVTAAVGVPVRELVSAKVGADVASARSWDPCPCRRRRGRASSRGRTSGGVRRCFMQQRST